MHIPADDLYAVLGVPPTADEAEIRRAYRRRIRQHHPDLQPESQRAHAHEEAAKLAMARDVLLDPVKRRDYDAGRGASTARPSSPPPPRHPRAVVVHPQAVDFGAIRVGETPAPQTVWISFRGGSPIRSARLRATAGRFWRASVIRADSGRGVHVHFVGIEIPMTAKPGQLTERLHVQVDEVAIDIPLTVTVEAAPRRPTPTPSPRTPLPEPTPVVARSNRIAVRRFFGRMRAALVVVMAVLFAGGVVVHHFNAGAPRASGEYCSVSSYNGQMLSFYRTKPGTTEAAGGAEVWSIMVPKPGDTYIAWWTPEFPYWERANQNDGFAMSGRTYSRFQLVEVLAVWSDPWDPLSTVFRDFPNLTGGSVAEAAERRLFADQWSSQLNSSACS